MTLVEHDAIEQQLVRRSDQPNRPWLRVVVNLWHSKPKFDEALLLKTSQYRRGVLWSYAVSEAHINDGPLVLDRSSPQQPLEFILKHSNLRRLK